MDYFLTSPRLGFRCWTSDDLPLALDLWGNPEVTALIRGPFSPDAVRTRLAQEIAQQSARGIQYWPLFLLGCDQFAGCAGLRPYRNQDNIFEVGIHLLPEFWRNGLATEAVRAVIDHAFGSLGTEALVAGHHPQNEASRKALLKLGFAFTSAELYPPTGLMHPMYRLSNPRSAAQ